MVDCHGLQELGTGGYRRNLAFEQALRVDRPPSGLSYATPGSLPATQGQRWKDVSSLMGASKAALLLRSQAATGA
jgi:hypothetical protein